MEFVYKFLLNKCVCVRKEGIGFPAPSFSFNCVFRFCSASGEIFIFMMGYFYLPLLPSSLSTHVFAYFISVVSLHLLYFYLL